MTTTSEIARRVEEVDSTRSARRTKAAQLVGELMHERSAVVLHLADINQRIGDAVVENSDVIDVGELAGFIGAAVADLTEIISARKPSKARRKRSTAAPPREQVTPELLTPVDVQAVNSVGTKEVGAP